MHVHITVYYERERIVIEWSVFEMTEKLSKREFVDENPYLVYTSEEDTAYNGSSGSGSIPIASADTLGGVKVGSGLTITGAGVLSASGGGSDIVEIPILYDDEQDGYYTNKKASEIIAEIKNGKYVIGVLPSEDTIAYFYIDSYSESVIPTDSIVSFTFTYFYSSTMHVVHLTVEEAQSVSEDLTFASTNN